EPRREVVPVRSEALRIGKWRASICIWRSKEVIPSAVNYRDVSSRSPGILREPTHEQRIVPDSGIADGLRENAIVLPVCTRCCSQVCGNCREDVEGTRGCNLLVQNPPGAEPGFELMATVDEAEILHDLGRGFGVCESHINRTAEVGHSSHRDRRSG